MGENRHSGRSSALLQSAFGSAAEGLTVFFVVSDFRSISYFRALAESICGHPIYSDGTSKAFSGRVLIIPHTDEKLRYMHARVVRDHFWPERQA